MPEEEFFNQLAPPVTDNISLNGVTDTIYLMEKEAFTYTLSAPGKKVYSHGVYLSKDYISSDYDNGKLAFELDPAEFSNGIHTLEIAFEFSGGTGSLADRLGSEVIHFQKNFVVKIDLSPPTKIAAPEVAIVDGRLMVEWKPADQENFYGYKVLKFYKDEDNIQRTDTLFSGSQEFTSLHDEFYAGGAVTYRVDIYGYKYYVPGEEKAFFTDPIKVKLELVDEHTVKFSWSDFLLYNNRLAFKLYKTNLFKNSFSHLPDGAFKIFQTIPAQKEGELIIDFETEFGNPELYKLVISPEHEDWYTSKWWTEFHEAAIGKKFHPFEAIVFNQLAKKMYLIYHPEQDGSTSRLVRYNLLSMQAEDSIDLQLKELQKIHISENGQYLYVEDQVGDDIQLQQINPETLDLQKIISLSDLAGPVGYFAEVSSVSNNNLLAFYNNKIYAVLDLNQSTISWQSSPDTRTGSQILISPDGDYLFHTQFDFVFNHPYTNEPIYHLFYYIHHRQDFTWKSIGRFYAGGTCSLFGFKNTYEKGFIFQIFPVSSIRHQAVENGVLGEENFYPVSNESTRITNYDAFQDAFYNLYHENNGFYLCRYDYKTEEKSGILKVSDKYQYGTYENMYFASSGYYYVVQK